MSRETIIAMVALEANLLSIVIGFVSVLYVLLESQAEQRGGAWLLARERAKIGVRRIGVANALFFAALLIHLVCLAWQDLSPPSEARLVYVLGALQAVGVALLLVGLFLLFAYGRVFVRQRP